MSKLWANINYVAAATAIKEIRKWLGQLEKILDKGIIDTGGRIPCRRNGDRRNGKNIHKSK